MKEQKLDLRDLVGQTLCYDIYDKDDPQEVEKIPEAWENMETFQD